MTEKVTVDTVTFDPHSGEYVLYLVEDGPWPSRDADWDAVLTEIQDRVLAAADVAIAGELSKRFPDSRGKPVRIQVDSPSGSPVRLDDLVSALAVFLAEDDAYSRSVEASPFIIGLRVTTGKQMGRFR